MLFEIANRYSGAVLFAMETNDFQRVVDHIARLGTQYWAKPVEKAEAEPWDQAFDGRGLFGFTKNP